jgi:hypothetical protein
MEYMELRNRFTYHAPFGDQAERYENIRKQIFYLAVFLDGQCPDSRELSLAITRLEEVSFWANASIARNETVPMVEE